MLFTHKTRYLSPAHEVLQHRALPGALAAHHCDLRQLEVAALADGAEGVLQFVNEGNQLLHPAVPHDELYQTPQTPEKLFRSLHDLLLSGLK